MEKLKAAVLWLWRYVFNVLVGLDQLANTFLAGFPDETISSRAGKGRLNGSPFWTAAAFLIDLLFLPFEPDHCRRAIEYDEGHPVRKR
jgi:hypothetical protein